MKPILDNPILGQRMRVLVVEDDESIRRVLVGGLRKNFDTLKAADGKIALDLIKDLDRPPDVILTDVNMPRVNGFELATALRKNEETEEIPIIMLTANADREFKLRALEFGVDDYVTKPFDMSEVRLRVRNLANIRAARLIMGNYTQTLELQVAERTADMRVLIEELTDTRSDLLNARTETVLKLGIACEYRDDDTAAHLTRMAQFTRIIGENMGLDAETIRQIEAAAPMHDIGKIGVPDNILQKPGKLTADEFKTMQTHPGIGARILQGSTSPLLKEAYIIALTHHEKWDGSGYPNGKSGEEIPLAGRIVALADVFDALTQKRCYKDAFSIEKSMSIINEGEGKHFDPDVVKAFKLGLDEAITIRDEYAD